MAEKKFNWISFFAKCSWTVIVGFAGLCFWGFLFLNTRLEANILKGENKREEIKKTVKSNYKELIGKMDNVKNLVTDIRLEQREIMASQKSILDKINQ